MTRGNPEIPDSYRPSRSLFGASWLLFLAGVAVGVLARGWDGSQVASLVLLAAAGIAYAVCWWRLLTAVRHDPRFDREEMKLHHRAILLVGPLGGLHLLLGRTTLTAALLAERRREREREDRRA